MPRNYGVTNCELCAVEIKKTTAVMKYCADCRAEAKKKVQLAYNPKRITTDAERAKVRERNLRVDFGITPAQYQELLDKQNGLCTVCERHHSEFNRRMAVDHNHKTGEIRGLLCNFCNHRVVGRYTDSSLLRRAADYLDRTTGWFVPEKKKRKKKKVKK